MDEQPTSKVRKVLLAHSSQAFEQLSRNGVLLDPSQDGKSYENYHWYKKGLLILEFLWFAFFVCFGIGAFATTIVEVDIGSGWVIGSSGMIAVISVYTAVGVILSGLYIWVSVGFMRWGDEQLDEFLANLFAILTMFITGMGLLIEYFVIFDTEKDLGGLDNSNNDLNFRRVIHSIFAVYGIFGLMIIIRCITRHLAVEKVIIVNEAFGQQSLDIYKTTYKARTTANLTISAFFMWISSSIIMSFIIWHLVVIINASAVPPFKTIYLTTYITLGIVFLALTALSILWYFSSKSISGAFNAHMDSFYWSHAIMCVAIIVMLVGYRYTYNSVPDNQPCITCPIEDPAITVPALKLAYFNKLAIVELALLPLLAMGIAKGVAIMAVEFPIIHKKPKNL